MLIAICGKKRTGKDTVADYIQEFWGFQKRSFAQPIKKALEIIFDWPEEIWHSDELKEEVDPRWGISPRQAAQHIGTEWGQYYLGQSFPLFHDTMGRNLWVARALFDIDNEDVVVSDLRFPHEAEAIRDRGGFIIKIHRNLKYEDGHLSEIGVDIIDADFEIDNDKTKLHLLGIVDSVMEDIFGTKEGEGYD